MVVDNGGIHAHAPALLSGATHLTAGTHSFEVQFFECCGGPSGVDLILPGGVSYTCPEPCHLICPANITVCNDAGQCGAVVSYSPPLIDGDCRGLTISTSPGSGSFFAVGVTPVNCTATDAGGNIVSQCSFTVTVNDCEAPVVECLATTNPGGSTVPGANSASNGNLALAPDLNTTTTVPNPT